MTRLTRGLTVDFLASRNRKDGIVGWCQNRPARLKRPVNPRSRKRGGRGGARDVDGRMHALH